MRSSRWCARSTACGWSTTICASNHRRLQVCDELPADAAAVPLEPQAAGINWHVNLIGHSDALAWLRRALHTGRFAHAYLVTGPRSVGKRTFALEIAQALNCLAPDVVDRPDHTCQQCRMIERGVHPDVRVVRRAPERRMISMRPQALPGPPRDYTDNVQFIQSDA